MIRSVRITSPRYNVRGTGVGYKVVRVPLKAARITLSGFTLTTILNQQYVHTQPTPATVWTVNHNLGHIPHVTVYDSAGTLVGGKVDHNTTTKNSFTITFAVPFGGTAICT